MSVTAQPLFYNKIVPLNKEQHKDLYLEPIEGFEFASTTNSLYIAAIEFIKRRICHRIWQGQGRRGISGCFAWPQGKPESICR